MKRIIAFAIASLSLAGCVTTQTTPLAPNAVRIDTQAGGAFYAGKAVPATMRAAAKETLEAGYTHFRLAGVQSGQGSEVVGVVGGGSGYTSGYAPGLLSGGGYNGFETYDNSETVIRAHRENSSATVLMFNANEPGAKGAFNARAILAKYPES